MIREGSTGKHEGKHASPCFHLGKGSMGKHEGKHGEACFPALTLQKGSMGKHGSIDRASMLPWSGILGRFSLPYGKGKHDTSPEEALA
jgi:hypothetical protein